MSTYRGVNAYIALCFNSVALVGAFSMIVQLNRLIVDSTSEELVLYTGAVSSVRSCVITHQSTTVRHQPGPGQGLVTQHPPPHQGGPGLKLAPTLT